MSIYYGYSPSSSITSINQLVVIPFRVHYKAISKSYRYPYSLKDGYPPVRMYGKGWMNEASAIRILTHLFDNDNVLSDTFKIRYQLSCIMNDGREETATLMDVDMVNKRLADLHKNLFIIEETFIVSKFVLDYKNIVLMTIGFKQLDSATYGNESILEAVSVHHQAVPQ